MNPNKLRSIPCKINKLEEESSKDYGLNFMFSLYFTGELVGYFLDQNYLGVGSMVIGMGGAIIKSCYDLYPDREFKKYLKDRKKLKENKKIFSNSDNKWGKDLKTIFRID